MVMSFIDRPKGEPHSDGSTTTFVLVVFLALPITFIAPSANFAEEVSVRIFQVSVFAVVSLKRG